MPVCKKCKTKFPNRMIVDGRERILSNRKFCLQCSPFNYHNTKNIAKNDKEILLECTICGKEYRQGRNSGTSEVCSSCVVNTRRFVRQVECVEYKGGKCQLCGYNKCLNSLCFHHRNIESKSFIISGTHSRRWEIIRKELDKCDLLCMNCHGEIHAVKPSKKQLAYINKVKRKHEQTEKNKQKQVQMKENRLPRDHHIPKKEWLDQLLWMMPITHIAETYDVSDSAVIKWTRKYRLNRPGRGYWTGKEI